MPTAAAIRHAGLSRVGLLGTRFTIEQAFYRGRLEERHGVEVLVPAADDRDRVHRVIYENSVSAASKTPRARAYRAAMRRLVERGAQGIVLPAAPISDAGVRAGRERAAVRHHGDPCGGRWSLRSGRARGGAVS